MATMIIYCLNWHWSALNNVKSKFPVADVKVIFCEESKK